MKKIKLLILLLLAFGTLKGQQQEVVNLSLKGDPYFFKTPVTSNLILPTGVAENSKGHIFIVNKGTMKLLEFDANGNFLRSLADGVLVAPHGLRIDEEDNIWVTDLELHLVIKINPDGHISLVLGQKDKSGLFDETRNMILFYKPADIAFGLNAEIYIADGYGNSRIVKLDKEGNFIKAWGEKGTENGNFDNPHNIVVDNEGLIYVADRYNDRIQIFNANGDFINSWKHVGTPWGLAISKQQVLYMTDGTNEKILKLNLNGDVLGGYSNAGQKPGQMRAAHGIALDKNDHIYVTEVLNWRVQKFYQKSVSK